MGISIRRSRDLGSSALTLPAGVINPFAGVTAPDGWLLCYGQAISRTQYVDLFNALSTTYGTGDGSTTFNLPDMRGRTIAGKDNMGGTTASRITSAVTGVTGTTLGAAGGTQDAPLHNHANTASFSGNTGSTSENATTSFLRVVGVAGTTMESNHAVGRGTGSYADNVGGAYPQHSHPFTPSGSVTMSNANAGTGTSGNLPPTIILNYIIKV